MGCYFIVIWIITPQLFLLMFAGEIAEPLFTFRKTKRK